MTDPIGDMLTRIRNGLLARHEQVMVPYSNLKHRLADILVSEGYLRSVEKLAGDMQPTMLRLMLKYDGKYSAIRMIRRISTPGHRVYVGAKNLPYVYDDLGVAVISTPRGLMTNKQARSARIGGEIICEVF